MVDGYAQAAFRIGPHGLSAANPPLFLAEIGTFFNQDTSRAARLIARIADAARAVPEQPLALKGEVLHDPAVCLDDATMETYQSRHGEQRRERYRDLIDRKVLPLDQYARLFNLVRGTGLPLVLSVYDRAGADFAATEGASALKIASANITNIPLIRHVAGLGLPMLIDTGRSDLEEVARAVRTAQHAGAPGILVEHSPDGHPAPPANHNLRLLRTYAQAFELPVGLSDHHTGEEMMHMAIALGVHLIEKGITDDPDALEQDAAHALDLAALPASLRRLHACWTALGHGFRDKRVGITGTVATSQRQGLVAARDLLAGDRLDMDNVRFAWPARGVGAEHWDLVAGWTVRTKVAAGTPVGWADIHALAKT
ncbi:N-acetylneuraminate synthase family protein [Niveispirillum fermenti]|uniref:N-acetylneuraminate synthase family protein n=1 Tax=Niveispirillum fermenti TaxID=1233113 RepID=UPI003A883D86